MKQALIALFVAAFGLGLVADAEAKRIGGGRSSGMQRNITPQKPVAPAQGATAAPTAPVPQPSGMSRWLGPVVGLAAGIGLVALLSHFGLGEGFATIVMMLLITLAVFVVIRLLFGRRAPQQSQPLQYAGAGNAPAPTRFDAPAAGSSGSAAAPAAGAALPSVAGNVPADFDIEGFLRQAKLNFLRLQAANDAHNIEDIRNFSTPEMFAEIKLEIEERGGGTQQTDVVTLNAELLDVSEELGQYIASVRFHGAIRETGNAAPEAFDEAWHLTKPVAGDRGWVIAGIQQFS